MAWKSPGITSILRSGVTPAVCALLLLVPCAGAAQNALLQSQEKDVFFGGGFIIPIHPEVYTDAATGIGVRTITGLGVVLSDRFTVTGQFGIGYVPAGYKIEPEFLELCSDQYEFESLIFLYGMSDLRIYTVPDENRQVRPYILAGTGIWNTRQNTTFTARDSLNYQCIILDESSETISKWSIAANGGFGLEISIEQAPFNLFIQARYFWVKDAIFKNMQNIMVEMVASFHL
jgi:hypothetical protein